MDRFKQDMMRKAEGRPAGLGLRLVQKTVDEFKNTLGQLIPNILALDTGINKLHETWNVSFLFGLIKYTLELSNTRFNNPQLDLQDTKFEFTTLGKTPMLKVDFPALKSWKLESHLKMNTWILP